MLKKITIGLSLLLMAFAYQNCGKNPNKSESSSNLSSFNEEEVPGFASAFGTSALRIFAQDCRGCHGPNSSNSGGIDYILNESQLISSGLVIPGNPEASPLFQAIIAEGEGRMPPYYGMSRNNIETIESWIASLPITGETTPTPVPNPQVPTPVTFAQVNGVLLTYCLACHSSGNPNGGGIDLGTYTAVLNYIVPNDALNSQLYQSIDQGRMPQNGGGIPTNDLSLIQSWIDQGAPNL